MLEVNHVPSQEKAPYEVNLARAVSTGPVTVAIEVVNSMYAYGAGVYDETNCKNQVRLSFISVFRKVLDNSNSFYFVSINFEIFSQY